MPGAFAIDGDIERGVVDVLRKLEVAEEGELGELLMNLFRKGEVVLQVAAEHGDFDGRGRTEAHHLADDVGCFEGGLCSGEFLRERGSQLFTESFAVRGIGGELNLKNGFLRSAGKEMDEIHGIAGGDDADEIAGDLDVIVAGFVANDVESVQDALNQIDVGLSAMSVRSVLPARAKLKTVEDLSGGLAVVIYSTTDATVRYDLHIALIRRASSGKVTLAYEEIATEDGMFCGLQRIGSDALRL